MISLLTAPIYFLFPPQREHSNIIGNLRATNEPVLCVTEVASPVPEQKDTPADTGTGANLRQRKKIERNPSAPLPGMLQVSRLF